MSLVWKQKIIKVEINIEIKTDCTVTEGIKKFS